MGILIGMFGYATNLIGELTGKIPSSPRWSWYRHERYCMAMGSPGIQVNTFPYSLAPIPLPLSPRLQGVVTSGMGTPPILWW